MDRDYIVKRKIYFKIYTNGNAIVAIVDCIVLNFLTIIVKIELLF